MKRLLFHLFFSREMAGYSGRFLSVIVLFVYLYSYRNLYSFWRPHFGVFFMNAALSFINDSHGRKKEQYFLNFTHCLLESICSSQKTLSEDHVIRTNQPTTKHAQPLCALQRLGEKIFLFFGYCFWFLSPFSSSLAFYEFLRLFFLFVHFISISCMYIFLCMIVHLVFFFFLFFE